MYLLLADGLHVSSRPDEERDGSGGGNDGEEGKSGDDEEPRDAHCRNTGHF